MRTKLKALLLGLACACVSQTAIAVTIVTVPVGNAGNAGQLSGDNANLGPTRVCGAVNYNYSIGKYEISAGQYTEFLNAVAATDTNGLYSTGMGANPAAQQGTGITRSGASGSYTYSVAADYANRPVNYVSYGQILRFCNWLQNGQPTGAQNASTTEDGSYTLNGSNSGTVLGTVMRNPNARWVLPTEDEWYKAAYHKNDGVTGNYFAYPTSSDSAPGNNIVDTGNNANYFTTVNTIGAPYWRTEDGTFADSASPYGTFDQGGNVFEYTDSRSLVSGSYYAVLRGGSFNGLLTTLDANNRDVNIVVTGGTGVGSTNPERYMGFRVVDLGGVPEPASLGLLGLALAGAMRRRR